MGFAIRAATLNQGLFGDELSTAWIVHGRSLGRVIQLVYSDAEVTPPLSFVLAWISLKIGSSWEWLRLPSLLGGTATIPIVYAIGVRTASRRAGLIAAAVTALSAVMIMFSTEARNYAVMMACVAGSTLSVLLALDTGRARWWVLYGATSCLAMYSHYTAAFVLIAQVLWVLWRHPTARRAVLLANAGAAAVYAPWIPGWIKDTHSVTIPIINALLPFNAHFVLRSAAEWAVGYPYLSVHQVPGVGFGLLIGAGLVLAVIGVGIKAGLSARSGGWRAPRWDAQLWGPTPDRVVLIGLLAIATLLGEAIYSALGTRVLDSRDLNASWPALAVLIGVLVSAAGPLLGTVSCALLLAGYGASAVDTLQARWQRPNYPAVARFITSHARPGDVVIDASNVPVVPLTALDAYLPQDHPEFRLGLPEGPPPYTLASKVPPGSELIAAAIRDAARGRLFVVNASVVGEPSFTAIAQRLQEQSGATSLAAQLPHGFRIVASKQFPGIETLTVSLITLPRGPRTTVPRGGRASRAPASS
jgi:hypothetical protein